MRIDASSPECHKISTMELHFITQPPVFNKYDYTLFELKVKEKHT
jgi:hypothetical protein